MELLAQDLQVTLEGNHILKGVTLEAGAGEAGGGHRPQRQRQKHPSSNASTVNWSLRGRGVPQWPGFIQGDPPGERQTNRGRGPA